MSYSEDDDDKNIKFIDTESEVTEDDESESTDIDEQLCPCCGFFNDIKKKYCEECDFELSSEISHGRAK